jgi:stage IV sporulation protein FB
MRKNQYSREMGNRSDSELSHFVENNNQFSVDEVSAARWELENRGQLDPEIKDNNVIEMNDINENIDVIENNYDSDIGFPKKPIENINSTSINKSLISLALFIGLFYLVFKWNIAFILVLTGVILIHEVGHYLAMKIFKYKDLSIFFVPLIGAFASGTKDTISQKQNVIILLAGPIPGVIIGLILYYYGLRDQSEFLLKTSKIFLVINLFNLLPIMPLDGGGIIKNIFFDSNVLINKIFLFISIGILTYFSLSTQSYILLIIPFFLLLQINNQSQLVKIRKQVKNNGINLDKSYDELSDEEYWLIRDELAVQNKYYSKIITPKKYILSDSENRIIKQVKLIIQKQPLKDLKLKSKILIMFFWIMAFVIPIFVVAIYYIKLGIKIK